MKLQGLLILLILGLTSPSAEAFLQCQKGDSETVVMAQDLHLTMDRLFKARVISRAEALRAELFLYEAQLCSNQIEVQRFCQVAMPILRELNLPQDERFGTLPPDQRRENITLMAQAKLLCHR